MDYIAHIGVLSGIYIMLSLSLNLVIGYTGLVTLTHAAFYGIGAYAVGIALTRFDAPFLLAMIIAIVLTAIVAMIVGVVLSRFRDDYFLLGSFACTMIAYSLFLNLTSITGGPLGMSSILRPTFFNFSLVSPAAYVILVGFILCIVHIIINHVISSSFGRVLRGIREDEEATALLGYRVWWFKLTTFVLSGAIAGLSGAIYATFVTFIEPGLFTINESVLVVAMIVLGGLASIRGSYIGAIILVILPELLRFVGFSPDVAAYLRQMIYGLLLILFMRYRPVGIFGKYRL